MKTFIHENYGYFERVRQRRKAEVRPLVQEAWYEFTNSEALQRLIESMQKRLREVIAASGENTSY